MIIVRIINPEIYGHIVYANSIILFLRPFTGMGSYLSLIRFGAASDSFQKKQALFLYSLKKGILFSALLLAGVLLASPFLTANMPEGKIFLIILSFQLLTLLFFEIIKSYARILYLNKLFSLTDSYYSLILLFVGVLAGYLWGGYGYALGIVIAPLFAFLLTATRLNWKALKFAGKPSSSNIKGFWRYGLYVGIGAIASQLLYTIDIFYIGNLVAESGVVAHYKIASLIPFSLFFLPLSFINTDYVKVANRWQDANFLKQYARNYVLLFLGIAIVLSLIFFFASELILGLVFGEQYQDAYDLFRVFTIGMCGAFILRIPFGNILAAIGKARWNTIIAFIILSINLIANYWMINWYGAIGAAYTTVLLIWISGLMAFGGFVWHLQQLKKELRA